MFELHTATIRWSSTRVICYSFIVYRVTYSLIVYARANSTLRTPLYSLIVSVFIVMFVLFYIQLFSYFRCKCD